MNSADIDAQVGRAQGLWTHTPVDWGGNLAVPPTTAPPTGWPSNAAQGAVGSGSRPNGVFVSFGPPGTVGISNVYVSGITATTANVTFTLSAAPTSSRVNYGTTQAVTGNTAGTTATTQTVALSGLTTKTPYFYSVQASNGSGTSITVLLSFTTL